MKHLGLSDDQIKTALRSVVTLSESQKSSPSQAKLSWSSIPDDTERLQESVLDWICMNIPDNELPIGWGNKMRCQHGNEMQVQVKPNTGIIANVVAFCSFANCRRSFGENDIFSQILLATRSHQELGVKIVSRILLNARHSRQTEKKMKLKKAQQSQRPALRQMRKRMAVRAWLGLESQSRQAKYNRSKMRSLNSNDQKQTRIQPLKGSRTTTRRT